jgi:adenylate cyclase
VTRRARREWLIVFWVSVASAIISAWFGIQVAPPGEWWLRSATHGVLTSLLIATPILWMQFRGEHLAPIRRLRRLPLVVYFALKTFFYFAVIVGGLILVRYLLSNDLSDYVRFTRTFRQSLFFAIGMALIGNLFFEFGTLLGLGTLKNLLTGRYVQPRTEQRIFLLIDMKNSTGLAERLGPVRFHELLNHFFRDVTDAALECDAEIYKYVGDEAILTWLASPAVAGGDSMACPFLALDNIVRHRSEYLKLFGEVPEFRAALHCGEIVAGEIGDVRREIAYVGDTLNVATRLLDAAKTAKRDVLVSADFLHQSKIPAGLTVEPLPTLTLRGREASLEIAALSRTGAAP